jgi:hypothetical protein
VHHPDVSSPLLRNSDAMLAALVSYWAQCDVTPLTQQLIMGMPTSMGGLGLTPMAVIAHAAYLASVEASRGATRYPVKQKDLTITIFQHLQATCVVTDPGLARHMISQAHAEFAAGMACLTHSVAGDVFSAALRTALRAMSHIAEASLIDGSLACPGCSRFRASTVARYSPTDWAQHVGSCVAIPGGMVDKRHDAICAKLRAYHLSAGLACDAKEPRHLHMY